MTRSLHLRNGASPAASLSQAQPGPAAAICNRPLNVVLATPLGAGGRGGMDRLADLVIDELNSGVANEPISVTRLTTKGDRGKAFGTMVYALALAQLCTLALRGKVDVLHINLAADGSFTRKSILAAIARRARIPYIVHIHTGRFAAFWSGASPARVARIDHMMRESAGIVVLGGIFKQMVTQRLPGCADKTIVLPNATPPTWKANRHQGPDHPVRVTFLGVLCAAKGVPELIEALGQIGTSVPWTATLAGYGEIKEARARAAELGIASRIATPGWLSPRSVDALLAETDIFVLPSHSEGLPMSIIEAFAAGIPVVATPVNAVAEVVQDGVNGVLVPVGDVPGLKEALDRLIRDPDLRSRLGDAAFEDHRRRYHPASYIDRLARIWRQSAARAGD